uniref:Uncharacterized protein n=1 Tax=Aegilops tauschii subsp. strangulata TaxID=200361 RepID=A0A453G9H1_AEGTS
GAESQSIAVSSQTEACSGMPLLIFPHPSGGADFLEASDHFLMLYSTLQFPEDLKSRCPSKEDAPWSYLYYSKGKTIEIPNTREDFEVGLPTDVAFGLQPRQLDKAIAVARLRAKLHLSKGQYVLVAPKDQSDESNRQLLHWGAVDAGRLLSALQEKGIECAFPADDDDGPAGCERSILITSPGEALVKMAPEKTVISEHASPMIEHASSSPSAARRLQRGRPENT